MNQVLVPISIGELLDKISTLENKAERIVDQDKLANVNYEMGLLKKIAKEIDLGDPGRLGPFVVKLKVMNTQIWEAEQDSRFRASGSI